MTLATSKGRLQTKLVTFIILWAVTLVALVLTVNLMFGQMLLISMVVGLILELLWSWIFVHQPGWLTILLGLVEFLVIFAIAIGLDLGISWQQSLLYYLCAWLSTQVFLIYILPVWRLTWIDRGRELW